MKYTKLEAIYIVKFLKYRMKSPNQCKHTYMSNASIARHLNRSVSYVTNVCNLIKEDDIMK